MKEVVDSDVNKDVMAIDNVEGAALEFENKFKDILDKHAPIKVFQTRKNYSPYMSDTTKKLVKARNSWKEVAANRGYRSNN